MAGSAQGSSGGGGGRKPSDGEGDPAGGGKDRNQKKEQEGKKDPLHDNEKGDPSKEKGPKSGDGKPESGAKSPEKPKGPVPPPDGKVLPPDAKDARGVFFAKLPDKVREAVLNGDFDHVPEKYRDLIREWTAELARKENEERASGESK